MKYAYDYSNMYTRGWVRAVFNSLEDPITEQSKAAVALEEVAKAWSTDTDLRLVEIADDGTETLLPVTGKGSRGPLPSDKKDS